MDTVFNAFLDRTKDQAAALSAESDLVTLTPESGPRPRKYMLELSCRGLIRVAPGDFAEADRWLLGIHFPAQYLKGPVSTFEVLNFFGPVNAWHPNISDRAPFICIGHFRPALDIVSIVYQVYELVTWQAWASHDGLNHLACRWARQQPAERFPVDRRPLKWKAAS